MARAPRIRGASFAYPSTSCTIGLRNIASRCILGALPIENEHRESMDDRDRTILTLLQKDAQTPLAQISEAVSLSPSACSRRIQRLEEEGYIAKRVAVLDRRLVKLPTTVFVLVRTSHHSGDWLEHFRRAVGAIPEIVEVHRLTGNVDYILKMVLPDVEHYDIVYKRLIGRLELFEMSAYISMETLKAGTEVPTSYA
jgi:Lrp/AsnC family transcriptional regulator